MLLLILIIIAKVELIFWNLLWVAIIIRNCNRSSRILLLLWLLLHWLYLFWETTNLRFLWYNLLWGRTIHII